MEEKRDTKERMEINLKRDAKREKRGRRDSECKSACESDSLDTLRRILRRAGIEKRRGTKRFKRAKKRGRAKFSHYKKIGVIRTASAWQEKKRAQRIKSTVRSRGKTQDNHSTSARIKSPTLPKAHQGEKSRKDEHPISIATNIFVDYILVLPYIEREKPFRLKAKSRNYSIE